MTNTPPARSLSAVFTVTVESPTGPAYFDREGFVLHAVSRIEGALEDSDDIRDVTIVEVEPAPGSSAVPDRAAVLRELADQQTQLAVADDLARRRDMATARRQLVKELRRLAAEAQQTECTCVPAPHREEGGTYSHWAGCPIADAEQAAAGVRQPDTETPCGPAPDQCDAEVGEPCADHERQQAHAEGEHAFCGPECGGEETDRG